MVDVAPRERAKSAPASSIDAEVDEQLSASTTDVSVDIPSLTDQLLGTWRDVRLVARELSRDPALHNIPDLKLADQRARTLDQMHILVERGAVHRAFPKRLGGEENNGGNIAGFEELVAADPSLQIKSGVQWGLFASAVLQLGTPPQHDKFLPDIMSLKIPGAFAMTETGHGSDVASVATTATYDPKTQEFVINTPFRAAWKEYLGNAGQHGKAATVFAQLITDGVNHGVHCFYVPIRDEAGNFLPGIGGEDDGPKGGLNGIDNGRLHFTDVRVPRTNLLNKYGDVAEDGSYSSPIDSPGRRFFTMLGTLVQGRVSLDGAAAAVSAMALKIAITYGNQRRQFTAASDTDEEVILDYQRHQRRLIPRLATTYAMNFAHDEFLVKFDAVFSGKADTDADREDLETLAASLKPLSTWAALDILQEAREACGGAGFITENRLTGLRADLDIYVTFEGDNNVLLQLVAKRLLSDYAKQFKGADSAALARFAVAQGAAKAYHGAGLRTLGQRMRDFGSTARSVSELRDAETQQTAPDRSRREHGRRACRSPSPGFEDVEEGCRGAVQLAAERTHRGGSGTRRTAAVGGVHSRRREREGRGHPAGARLAARHLRARTAREAPGLVPHQRPAVAAARAGRHRVPRPTDRARSPARPGPRGRVRLRARAPAREDRDGCRARAPGRGARVLPRAARIRYRTHPGEVAQEVSWRE